MNYLNYYICDSIYAEATTHVFCYRTGWLLTLRALCAHLYTHVLAFFYGPIFLFPSPFCTFLSRYSLALSVLFANSKLLYLRAETTFLVLFFSFLFSTKLENIFKTHNFQLSKSKSMSNRKSNWNYKIEIWLWL